MRWYSSLEEGIVSSIFCMKEWLGVEDRVDIFCSSWLFLLSRLILQVNVHISAMNGENSLNVFHFRAILCKSAPPSNIGWSQRIVDRTYQSKVSVVLLFSVQRLPSIAKNEKKREHITKTSQKPYSRYTAWRTHTEDRLPVSSVEWHSHPRRHAITVSTAAEEALCIFQSIRDPTEESFRCRAFQSLWQRSSCIRSSERKNLFHISAYHSCFCSPGPYLRGQCLFGFSHQNERATRRHRILRCLRICSCSWQLRSDYVYDGQLFNISSI